MITGIKRRVFKQLTIFTIITSLLFLSFTWLIAFVVEDEVIYAVLNNEAQYLKAAYQRDKQLSPARADYLSVHLEHSSLPTAVQKKLKHHPRAKEFFTEDGHHFHLLPFTLFDDKPALLLADVPHLLVVSRMSKQMMILFTFVFICCFALAIFFAYRISARSVKPIVKLAHEIGQFQGSASEIQLATYPDEIGFLAKTLQASMNELNATLQREKHFTRDVSHELRTPLTILTNELQLLSTKLAEQTNLSRMQDALDDIQNTISVLFALARAESLQSEHIDLTGIFEQVLLDLYQEIELQQIELDVSLCDKSITRGNRTLAKLLLINLLNNALRYSSQNVVQITLTAKHFIIANAFESSPVTESTEYFLTAGTRSEESTGLGQGLFLSQRIAQSMGWQLSLQTDNNTFMIQLTFN